MARPAPSQESSRRERRDQAYQASEKISIRFPGTAAITLNLRFVRADRSALGSPYKQIYTADMRAYFQLQCHSKECVAGGFDLSDAVRRAAESESGVFRGNLPCGGHGSVSSANDGRCPVCLNFEVVRLADHAN
jgi:hypothetical protein